MNLDRFKWYIRFELNYFSNYQRNNLVVPKRVDIDAHNEWKNRQLIDRLGIQSMHLRAAAISLLSAECSHFFIISSIFD